MVTELLGTGTGDGDKDGKDGKLRRDRRNTWRSVIVEPPQCFFSFLRFLVARGFGLFNVGTDPSARAEVEPSTWWGGDLKGRRAINTLAMVVSPHPASRIPRLAAFAFRCPVGCQVQAGKPHGVIHLLPAISAAVIPLHPSQGRSARVPESCLLYLSTVASQR